MTKVPVYAVYEIVVRRMDIINLRNQEALYLLSMHKIQNKRIEISHVPTFVTEVTSPTEQVRAITMPENTSSVTALGTAGGVSK